MLDTVPIFVKLFTGQVPGGGSFRALRGGCGMTDVGEMEPGDDAAPVQAIVNAADALGYIAGSTRGVGVRELSRELRLARGTAARVLHSLHVCGLVRRDDETGRFGLGARFLELAAAHRRSLSLSEIARPHMTALSRTSRETVFLAVPDGPHVVIVDRVDGEQPLRMTGELGVRESAFHTALGRIMLAALPHAARIAAMAACPAVGPTGRPTGAPEALSALIDAAGRRGWALDDGEQVEGVRCVAAAIRDQERRVIAAVSVSGPAFRLPDDRIEATARHVTAAAAAISRDLGYAPAPVGMSGGGR
jgi:DNA-binding IclR family transcriptional regulator